MTYSQDVLTGLARDLAERGFGVYHDDPAAPLPVDEVAIVLGVLPESPAEVVALMPYLPLYPQDTYRQDVENAELSVQLKYRVGGGVLAAQAVYDQVHDAYHRRTVSLTPADGAEPFAVRGREVSAGPIGPDANQRFVFSHNIAFRGLRARP